MSLRVEVPPYRSRQMVYDANGGSRLMGWEATTKQISKEGRTAATMMGPLGIVKEEPGASEAPNPNQPTTEHHKKGFP